MQRSGALVAAAAVLQAIATSAQNCANVWETLPPMGTELGEVSAGVVKINGQDNLCVVGQGSDVTECYDFAAGTWSASAPVRGCTGDHHCTVDIGNTMYLVGGLSDCETSFMSFDGSSWTNLPDVPFETGSGACGHFRGKITMCSGLDGTESTDECAEYDIASGSWSPKGTVDVGLNHAAYCTKGRQLYVIGGRQGRNSALVTAESTCQTKDMRTGSTGSCPDLPLPLGGVGNCVNSVGGFWIFGSELNRPQFEEFGDEYDGVSDNVNGRGGVLPSVMYFSRRRNRWERKTNMPIAKHGIFPVVYNGYVYIVGGGIKSGGSESDTFVRAKLRDLKRCDY